MAIVLWSLGIIVLIGGAGYYVYEQRIRRFKPSKYGVEDFQRIARWESAEWRDRAYKRGITRLEWQQVLMRQNDEINAELRRRGIE